MTDFGPNDFSLLVHDDFLAAPITPLEKFSYLENIARNRLFQIIQATETDQFQNHSVRNTYVATVQGLANKLLDENLHFSAPHGEFLSEFDDFMRKTTSRSIEASLGSYDLNSKSGASITQKSRARIENAEKLLRSAIDESTRSESEKKRLHEKIDELLRELRGTKPVTAKWAFNRLAYILMALGGGTAFFADAPEAYKTLNSLTDLIFEEVFAADEELMISQDRIPRLEAPDAIASKTPQRTSRLQSGNADSEEMPF